MNLKNLEKLLSECVDPSNPEHIRAKEPLVRRAQQIGWEYVAPFMYDNLSKSVQNELESLPFYQNYKGCFVNQENGSVGFHPEMVAQHLVQISFQRSVQSAMNYFNKMTRLQYADGYSVVLLLGIDVEEKFEIYPGIYIGKIEDLPSSNSKEHYVGNESNWILNNPHSKFMNIPKCALYRKIRIDPLIYNSGGEPAHKNPLESNKLFDDIALLLTLAGPSPVLTSIHWFEFEDNDIQGVRSGGGAWFNHEIFPNLSPRKEMATITSSARKDVSSYFSIADEKLKNRLSVALERLSIALRRRRSGDAALELSIAFETIFAEDYGENTFKIGLRAALLVSDDVQDRKRIRSVISSLYKMRSMLVHRGETSETAKVKGFESMSSDELVKESSGYLSRAIKKILILGCIPDWNEYELKIT